MSKKLSREKRRDLRARGQLRLVPRVADDVRRAEQRAEEEATGARVHEARAEIAEHAAEDRPEKGTARRDRTVLVLVALTAAAGLIFWLTQRSTTPDTKIDVGAPVVTATAPAAPMVMPPPLPRPAITAAPVVTAPPAGATAPAPPPESAPAAPAKAAPKPRGGGAAPQPKPKAPASDPYG